MERLERYIGVKLADRARRRPGILVCQRKLLPGGPPEGAASRSFVHSAIWVSFIAYPIVTRRAEIGTRANRPASPQKAPLFKINKLR